jgi:hypothetical protein
MPAAATNGRLGSAQRQHPGPQRRCPAQLAAPHCRPHGHLAASASSFHAGASFLDAAATRLLLPSAEAPAARPDRSHGARCSAVCLLTASAPQLTASLADTVKPHVGCEADLWQTRERRCHKHYQDCKHHRGHSLHTKASGSCRRHCTPRACGIIGIHKQGGFANAELYEGLLSLQHRGQVRTDTSAPLRLPWHHRALDINILGSCSEYIAALTAVMCPNVIQHLHSICDSERCRCHQDSAGMVTTDWVKFHERKDNGLVSDVFNSESRMRKLPGALRSLVSCRHWGA